MLKMSYVTQVIQIHLWPFRRNSLLKCVSQRKIFKGSRSFKVIDVNTNKKLVTIACYD